MPKRGRRQSIKSTDSVRRCLHSGCGSEFDHGSQNVQRWRVHMLSVHENCPSHCVGCAWCRVEHDLKGRFGAAREVWRAHATFPESRRRSSLLASSSPSSAMPTLSGLSEEPPTSSPGITDTVTAHPLSLVGANAMKLLRKMGVRNNLRPALRGLLLSGMSASGTRFRRSHRRGSAAKEAIVCFTSREDPVESFPRRLGC